MSDNDTASKVQVLRKASRAIHAACHPLVAEDMARIFTGAADEIERLTAERDRLRVLLQPFAFPILPNGDSYICACYRAREYFISIRDHQ